MSARPALLALDYNPTETKMRWFMPARSVKRYRIFDSGGYSIKQSAFYGLTNRYGRRGDSNGALAFAITRGPNKRVKLFLCCADNLISGKCV
ncbi:hypothetical protein KCP69_09835 [Salmonella enterica subsp. enterica]|nr:hypothetical protein KCP69_09835 [Salmonella enterica subsp. enterica]